jgi:hypothetical protein
VRRVDHDHLDADRGRLAERLDHLIRRVVTSGICRPRFTLRSFCISPSDSPVTRTTGPLRHGVRQHATIRLKRAQWRNDPTRIRMIQQWIAPAAGFKL